MLNKMKRDPVQLRQCLEAMGKTIQSKQFEMVPPAEVEVQNGRGWWIPLFPVTHPKKKKTRLVFDSSSEYFGVCLNRLLLQGPDQNNRLRGVLTRFREGELGFMADVEAMFHSFYVNPEQRDYLRFYWFKNNDPNDELVQFRARVHIFGNRPSPAIATFALRHAMSQSESSTMEARSFVQRNFYVDDGLGCANTPEEAVAVLGEVKSALSTFGIRLHKIVSSSRRVVESFPTSERAEELSEIDFESSSMHRTLGVSWSVLDDSFVIKTDVPNRPFTKRGVLATVNSVFDPLGMVSPIVLGGRILQRQIIAGGVGGDPELRACEWDDPLPDKYLASWRSWTNGLESLEVLSISRGFRPLGFGPVLHQELHVFSDASSSAIGYVMYLRSVGFNDKVHVAFFQGDSKIAPKGATSIPRLELCAAMLAAQAAKEAIEELMADVSKVTFYCDSLVVLGYLSNEERRFKRYVARRVQITLTSAPLKDWQYISTDKNPADIASRVHTSGGLASSSWFTGPKFLWSREGRNPSQGLYVPLSVKELPENEEPGHDAFVYASATRHADTCVAFLRPLMDRVGTWRALIRIVSRLVFSIRLWLWRARTKLGILTSKPSSSTKEEVSTILIRSIQGEYTYEIRKIKKKTSLDQNHRFLRLAPLVDGEGVLRVGGRLRRGNLSIDMQYPVLLPKAHPGTTAIIHHFHNKVFHQGRHITLGAVRMGGFHIEGGSSMVKKILAACVICRRLRGCLQSQQMADLPPERLDSSPPFSHTGLDVFGPLFCHEGKNTRKNSAQKKVWVLLLTCLVTRAVHIEMLPSMDTPSFKNALRRFLAVRGTCKTLRSDHGTNIIGSIKQDQEALNLQEIRKTLKERDCDWVLSPPHASHFGGVWERKIGYVRRVLEGSLVSLGTHVLSRDELLTLLLEATAIVNSTPLWEVSTDPNDPMPLCPAMLLTLKDNPHKAAQDTFSKEDVLAYGKKRWRKVQAIAEEFWTSWRQSYLSQLQERRKWMKPKRSICVGDVVLLRDKSVKRNQWPLARVWSVKTSEDGLVRSATIVVVKKGTGGISRKSFFERPVSELVLLIPEGENST